MNMKVFRIENDDNFWKMFFYCKRKRNILSYLYKLKIKKIEEKYNCFIPTISNLENALILPHGLNGIFISQGAKIGKNCVVFHQVTIGSNTLSDSKNPGAPMIGDNCYIGAGAKIIGKVKIGNNCRIGANCVVVKDIPDNSTVVCAENRVIVHKEIRNNTFSKY